MRQSDPPPYRPRPGRTTGGYGAPPPTPHPARPPAYERHGPAPRRAAPTGTEQGPHTRTPAPTTRGWRTPTARPVGGQSGEGGRMTPDAPRNARRHPPPGRPAATPTTPSQVGGTGTGPPPPKHARRSKGPGQDTRRGTDHVERPDQRPVPGPREMRTPHHPGGAGERTPRERERTHTKGTRGDYRKGNRTERAERTDRVEWRTSERGQGTPGRDGPPHTARNTRGGEGETRKTRRQVPARTPRTGRQRRAHTDGALHPPRQ